MRLPPRGKPDQTKPMARECHEDSDREEAERHWMERRSRRLSRKRHLSKQERCELAEVRAALATEAALGGQPEEQPRMDTDGHG